MKRLMTMSLLIGVVASAPAAHAQQAYTYPNAQIQRYETVQLHPLSPRPLANEVRHPNADVVDIIADRQRQTLISETSRENLDRQLMRLQGL